jgi:hypothetical protein
MEPVAMEGLEAKRQTVFDEWKEMLQGEIEGVDYCAGQGHILIFEVNEERIEVNVAPPKEKRIIVKIEHGSLPDKKGGKIYYRGPDGIELIEHTLSPKKYEEWKERMEKYRQGE